MLCQALRETKRQQTGVLLAQKRERLNKGELNEGYARVSRRVPSTSSAVRTTCDDASTER